MADQDFKKMYKDFKKISALIGIGGFLKRIIYSRHEEIIQVKDLKELGKYPLKNKLKVHGIEKKDLPRLAFLRKQAGLEGEGGFKEYLDNGCHGFFAELNGEAIGYSWWGDNKSNFKFYPGYEYHVKEIITLGASDIYGFDFFIAPQYRGGGNALEFMGKCFLALRDLGYERNFGYVHSKNIAARWMYEIIGLKEVKKITVRRFFLFFLFKDSKYSFDDGLKWLFDIREIYVH